jgi:hypothetical protein
LAELQAAIRAEEQAALAEEYTAERIVALAEAGQWPETAAERRHDASRGAGRLKGAGAALFFPFRAAGAGLKAAYALARYVLSLLWVIVSLVAGRLPMIAGIALVALFWLFLGSDMDVDRTIETLEKIARPVIDVFRPADWNR